MKRLCVLGVLALAAVSCGGSDGDDASSAPSPTLEDDPGGDAEAGADADELFVESDEAGTGTDGAGSSDGASGNEPESAAGDQGGEDGEVSVTTVPSGADDGGADTGGATTTAAADTASGGDADATTSSATTSSATTSGGDGAASGGAADGSTTGAGGAGGSLTAADIDRSILLDAAELEAFGLGGGWSFEVVIEPPVGETDGLFCRLDEGLTVEHLYSVGANAEDAELEQAVIPTSGPILIEVFSALAECAEFQEEFGDAVETIQSTVAGAPSVEVTATVFGQMVSWITADVDGVAVLVFRFGDSADQDAFRSAFEQFVQDAVERL